MDAEEADTREYRVVVNHEERYSCGVEMAFCRRTAAKCSNGHRGPFKLSLSRWSASRSAGNRLRRSSSGSRPRLAQRPPSRGTAEPGQHGRQDHQHRWDRRSRSVRGGMTVAGQGVLNHLAAEEDWRHGRCARVRRRLRLGPVASQDVDGVQVRGSRQRVRRQSAHRRRPASACRRPGAA